MFSDKLRLIFGGLLVIAGILWAIRGPIEVKLLKARCTAETTAKVDHVFENKGSDLSTYDTKVYYYVGEKRYEDYKNLDYPVSYTKEFVCHYNPDKPKEHFIDGFNDGPVKTSLYGVAVIAIGAVTAGSVLIKHKNEY